MFRRTPKVAPPGVAPPTGFRSAPPAPAAGAPFGATLHDATVRMEKQEAKTSTSLARVTTELEAAKAELRRCTASGAPASSQALYKKRVLHKMRERNMLQAQLGHASNRAFNMQQVVAAKEGMESARDTVAIMQAGQAELKSLHAAVDIDKAQDVMDDMADTLADVEDVNETLSYDIGTAVVDETELEAEMDGLEAELAGGTASYVPAAPPVAVPSYAGGVAASSPGVPSYAASYAASSASESPYAAPQR